MTLLSSAPYTNGHEPDRQRQGHLQAVGLGAIGIGDDDVRGRTGPGRGGLLPAVDLLGVDTGAAALRAGLELLFEPPTPD